ncbi:hypothetical protein RvY_11871 [Ramazzottius varieornatus]|uniref:G-protein coupled receptors family 1 profile domain-containing protein n=1 Tax=Ramazzottius varieornatus TaxID=947166 RepID=A0A1D1VRC7_RAMVA|nr:hypothetical protein RvY_11871 [Ramazzottius varieornatus]
MDTNGSVFNFSGRLDEIANRTNAAADVATWNFWTIFNIFIQFSPLLTNGGVLYLFAREPSLLTPFTVYAVNLFIANIITVIFHNPLDVVGKLYSTWWIGNSLCTMAQYTSYVFCGGMCNAHALIAMNRLWAVTFPVSYLQKHQLKFAVGVCLSMWIYLNICVIPGILLDVFVYRPPVEIKGSNIATDAPYEWLLIMQMLIFNLPIVIVLLVFPVVCWKAFRVPAVRVRPKVETNITSRQTATRPIEAGTVAKTGGQDANNVEGPVANPAIKVSLRKINRNFIVLCLMTIGVLARFAPDQVYFTLLLFNINVPGIHPIGSMLFEFISILDPIWLVLTLTELRSAFHRVYILRSG